MRIAFRDREVAKVLKLIPITPSGVLLWAGDPYPDFKLEAEESVITLPTLDDGTCFLDYPFCEEDIIWLQEQLSELILSGDVVFS